ncbi:hypothetical protein [Paenibacillus pinihumi]|uniref:hypothetical protein n=1 Tax=Paenibacillus pinihumi TaxID=669462 RepID=UPI000428DF1E|nr:hypothetical protein [Paenibacillus pinihumi]
MSADKRVTRQELEMIRDYIVLPLMMDVVERNKRQIQFSTNSLKALYVAAADRLMDMIQKDHVALKKKLKEREIKVWESEQSSPTSLRHEYKCRGYHEHFHLLHEVAKTQISVQLGQYISKVFKKLE